MKKVFSILSLALLLIVSSCSDSKDFVIDGNTVTVEPYGWGNSSKKNENVEYDLVLGNVVWSVILSETIVAPVVMTGWYIYEPVSLKK